MSIPGYRPYEPQLEPVPWADDIWTVDGPEVRYKLAGVPLPCPTRMTVVRLPANKLWLHSPIAYSDQLAAALGRLGEIAAIVAPNSSHHLHVASWARAASGAEVHASPDLLRKLDRAHHSHSLGTSPAELWRADLAQHLVDLGTFKEVVFFHPRARTLIVTDLMQNFEGSRVANPVTRLLLKAGGAIGPIGGASIEIRIASIGHRNTLQAALRQMRDWKPASIILSHDLCYRTDAHAELERAFAWVKNFKLKRK